MVSQRSEFSLTLTPENRKTMLNISFNSAEGINSPDLPETEKGRVFLWKLWLDQLPTVAMILLDKYQQNFSGSQLYILIP